MVDAALGSKVPLTFVLLGFLITLKAFHTTRGYLNDKRKSSDDLMFIKGKSHYFNCINKYLWDLTWLFIFKDITHTDYKRIP